MNPRIEVTVAAPVEVVWEALRDKDKLRQWHGWQFEGLDEEIDTIYLQTYTEDVETHTLDLQGEVFQVTPHGSGAKVTVTRPPRGTDSEWDKYYDDITDGWITFLHQLKFALERHPDDQRRTIFVSGPAPDGSPIEDLSLTGIAAENPGTAYDADLLGENVTGTVWFRSENQLGLTVDGWGDGLLIVGRIGGSAMAVLTTYGAGNAAYEELARRWTDWWMKQYPA
jgi:hypothetical protein